MAKDEFNFDKDERVLCYHGLLLYEAKIIKREIRQEDAQEEEKPYYWVHYKGWKQTWDEWVSDDRVLKWTEPNLQKQQQLKEMHARRKPSSRSSSTISRQDSAEVRGRTRNRDSSTDKTRAEEESIRRSEFKLPIPELLKGHLVDDWENVTKNQQLVPLPRTPSVSEILGQYYQHARGREDETLQSVIDGVKLYFDKSLGTSLLYNAERKQFEEEVQAAHKTPSDVYGIEHLLRLFVNMPTLMSQSNVDPETLSLLKGSFFDLLR
ncbi:MRG-domain-containing protein [Zychaea mexicana]|uniref:MRG-domain-containing protein n=1 Tax=Zychaea mexicana TaxID=64656 RepID=UPI0022FED7E1|nr:MRG-domain-containing protein [Zychaea mexicana]KAI9482503.1 MRG-domain-containing protein [Zychaea mexicana]